METLSLAVMTGVLATADFCAAPIDGGPANPLYCRLSTAQRIETPFLSLEVDARFLIGVDKDGRRVMIGLSQHQNQAGLVIEIIPLSELANTQASDWNVKQYLGGQLACEPRVLGHTTWEWCVESDWEEKFGTQTYFLHTPKDLYYIQHYASGLGREQDPSIAELLGSIVAK
jgi:hypothetical protein